MKPEQQRIKIAEVCGWKLVWRNIDGKNKRRWVCHQTGTYDIRKGCPDYTNDLNAMHEAEKVLKSGDHKRLYFDWLGRLAHLGGTTRECATAAQRAEAFLKTLGLWEDGE